MKILLVACLLVPGLMAQANRGYYRFPTIHGNTVVFTAEGDLWQVDVEGGRARRVTTHAGEEREAAFSPDGSMLAFSADYEGPTEVYTMPAAGGLPSRRTFDGAATVVGWTPDGKVLYSTRRYSTLPDAQLASLDAENRVSTVPLSQASQGVYDARNASLFFTRLPFQGSHAKRYQGGSVQQIWRYTPGAEAVGLTIDFAGTSKDAMWWNGRVYFLSDRDGSMNIWSMDEQGKSVRQHTRHAGWDAASPSLGQGRIVYQLGPNLRVFDIAANRDRELEIELVSDFDHLRENWVKDPSQYLTSVKFSHDGQRIVVTARGKAFVVPAKQGRLVEATPIRGARVRDAKLLPDGKSLIALSTESGEVELWKLPANGVGAGEQLTTDGKVLRWSAVPSPDGKWIAHQDKDNQLWLLEVATKANKKIATADRATSNSGPNFADITWSPDSRWLAFSTQAANQFQTISLYRVGQGDITTLTTDRYNSSSPAWSPDGKWLYFLSDRSLSTVVGSPWGTRQPDPYFDKTIKIYELALKKGQRSPFEPLDELHPDKPEETAKAGDKPTEKTGDKPTEKAESKPSDAAVTVEIDLDGIQSRIREVPVPPGNYAALTAPAKRLCWLDRPDRAQPAKTALQCLDVANKGDKPESLVEEVSSYLLSGDGKKMLIRKQNDLFVIDAAIREAAAKGPKMLPEAKVDLKDWTFTVIPSEEFREMLLDAWRLHRDYFYDRNMHGLDWRAVREKYLPLASRVRDRSELSDVIAQMVSELSVLHTSVGGGDLRRGDDQIQLATLGAHLERDAAAGGYVVRRIYQSDPDRPDKASPLVRPGVEVAEGDTIVSVNGRDTLSVADIGELLRSRAGRQVLVRVKPKGQTDTRDVVVTPLTVGADADLRYGDWEYTRRLAVDRASGGDIGYVHLRAMGAGDMNQWAEHFYPVHDRQGLIIDVRHNRGGNIDSWLLGKLIRQPWFYWQSRVGQPIWNMQYAFRGHMVVLIDQHTASDGEAFAEGFRRLNLGKLIGTRTWGGEIWLSSSNVLVDRGIATAAEMGVYADGKWLIEGHGVDPDIVVDNLPNATFSGKDAQLEAAIAHLKKLIADKPSPVPPPPAYPNKRFPAESSSSSGGGAQSSR
jgi:tricorn protease